MSSLPSDRSNRLFDFAGEHNATYKVIKYGIVIIFAMLGVEHRTLLKEEIEQKYKHLNISLT